MLLGFNSHEPACKSYNDIEDLASVKLQGNKLAKFDEAWAYVLCGMEEEQKTKVLEYRYYTRRDLIKHEMEVYKRRDNRAKKYK